MLKIYKLFSADHLRSHTSIDSSAPIRRGRASFATARPVTDSSQERFGAGIDARAVPKIVISPNTAPLHYGVVVPLALDIATSSGVNKPPPYSAQIPPISSLLCIPKSEEIDTQCRDLKCCAMTGQVFAERRRFHLYESESLFDQKLLKAWVLFNCHTRGWFGTSRLPKSYAPRFVTPEGKIPDDGEDPINDYEASIVSASTV